MEDSRYEEIKDIYFNIINGINDFTCKYTSRKSI